MAQNIHNRLQTQLPKQPQKKLFVNIPHAGICPQTEPELSKTFYNALGILIHEYLGEVSLIQMRNINDRDTLRTETRNLQLLYAARCTNPVFARKVSDQHYQACF